MKRLIAAIALSAAFAALLSAATYQVAVPQLSPLSTDTYKALITAILEATGNAANAQVKPFARCVYEIETKAVDIVSTMVALPDQKKWANLKYDYSTAEAVKIVFVLYTNKNKPIDPAELKKGNPKGYKLETDAAHLDHFGFPISASTSVDASLKKVDSGEIDGYIFSQSSADAALKRLGYANVRRQLFDTFSGTFLIPKGGRGGPVDALISDGLAKIKANGKYQEIVGQLIAGASKYLEWQPQ
jgi:polar amino acid transport system substrate-binding protein